MDLSFFTRLEAAVERANSSLCVGLDPDWQLLPESVRSESEPLYVFNREIIDATAHATCAFKFQIAYYASLGREDELEKSIAFLRTRYRHIPVILDAKRGDIGSTAEQYAKECFERFDADAVTVNPYLGSDSVLPFTRRADRGVFIVCRTSNPSAGELQDLDVGGRPLYQIVADLALKEWNANGNVGLVAGGTYVKDLKTLRQQCGSNIWFLVPGIGAQGARVSDVVENGANSAGSGLLISASRSIIFASRGADFPQAARRSADGLREETQSALRAFEAQRRGNDRG